MKHWRWLGVLLLILLFALQAKLWFSKGGMRGIHALHASVEAQKAQNTQLEKRNQTLAADVSDLKQGDVAIEARARNNLGLIKPGEIYYRVIGPAPPGSSVAPPSSSP